MMWSTIAANNPTEYEIRGIAHCSAYRVRTTGPLCRIRSLPEGANALINPHLAMIASSEIEGAYPINVFLMHPVRLHILDDVERVLFPEAFGR
ncbi:hypothetical protein F4811DRAFT_46962 [Daldinia bambusicola]|nr:hypothetical protein F4811DRAFT_46962 [Daldinia bambusicola]